MTHQLTRSGSISTTMSKRQSPEHDAQAALVEWLRLRGVGVFAVPNGASLGTRRGVSKEQRGRIVGQQMRKLKAEGLELGAPDLVLHRLCRCCAQPRPIAIEMKAPGVKTVPPEQRAVHADLEAHGWHVVVGSGFDDARRKVEALL